MNFLRKKIGYIVILTPLSLIATYGCDIQYRKYGLSTKRWAKIDQQINTFTPITLDQNLPWYNIFYLKSTKGTLGLYKIGNII